MEEQSSIQVCVRVSTMRTDAGVILLSELSEIGIHCNMQAWLT